MSWAKVDDQLAFHRKTIAAGNPAMGLWVRALSWLAGQEGRNVTDPGVITVDELKTMGTAQQITRLIDVGFLERCKLGGVKACRFNDWPTYQPTPEQITAKREEWAARKARSRAHRDGDHSTCLPRYCADAPPNPEREEHLG